MRKRNRLVAVGIVGTAVIAACIGNLTLSETEQQTMSYPGSASAGSVMIGSSGTTPPIVFTPATEKDNDTIMTISENCGRWSLSLKPLPANVYCSAIGGETYGSGSCVPNTYSFTGTFTPTGPGLDSCAVTVSWESNTSGSGSGSGTGTTGTQTFQIVLNGTGVAPAYSLTMIPANGSKLEYTDIPINTVSSAQRITITNSGSSALSVMGAHTNMTAFPVTPLNGASFTNQSLGPGQSASYDVTCNPTAVQAYAGTITFKTSPAQGDITRTVDLACNGISSNLVITPNPAGFARNALVGVPPPNLTINIMNSGADTTFTEVRLTSGTEVAIVQQPTSPLMGGASTSIVLSYSAATEHPFGRIDNLVITHTPGGTRTVAINAEALVGEIGVTPALVDFGPVCPGSEKTAELMVYASSSGPVNVTSITQPGAPFAVTGTGGMLEPNHGNIITLVARVSATTAGELDDEFTLNTNLPGAAAMHEVQLEGVALPAGVTPTPNVVHFGPGRIGATTTAKKITVSNCGTGELEITGARIVGPSASEFAIVGPEDPLQTIPTMGELQFLVIMNPSTTGTKNAKLVVEHAGGVIEADLDGNGFGIDDAGGEKTTYYTCSAGGAGGAPLVLALVGLGLRRRRRRRA